MEQPDDAPSEGLAVMPVNMQLNQAVVQPPVTHPYQNASINPHPDVYPHPGVLYNVREPRFMQALRAHPNTRDFSEAALRAEVNSAHRRSRHDLDQTLHHDWPIFRDPYLHTVPQHRRQSVLERRVRITQPFLDITEPLLQDIVTLAPRDRVSGPSIDLT